MASQIEQFDILYGRLSQEDDKEGVSGSIEHQRILLEEYARRNGFENPMFLADDGYSGTNFERPSWKKIIDMIEAGQVRTLIVKDMSRLGREYLKTGYYTEIYFPEKGVRFIAVNDGVDSLVESSSDFNPIRNWFNEQHARDTSKKVRTVMRMKAERGERTGGRPPYGYRPREGDCSDIIPDEEVVPIVLHIFQLCASGKGPNQIARILKEEQILTPSHYSYRKYGFGNAQMDMAYPYNWSATTIRNILGNKVYLGHTVGLKKTTVSYKIKKEIIRPESEQVVVENTHEPIISQDLWDRAQRTRQNKRRAPKHMDEPNIFSGLIFCADCGKKMTLHRASSMKKQAYNFMCSTYGKRGKDGCSAHYIREDDLKAVVLDDLRRVTHFARLKERQFAEYINNKNSTELRKEIHAVQKELDMMKKRSAELSKLFKRIYEDQVLGRVTAEQFRMLSDDYNAEQKTLELSIPDREAKLEKLQASASNVEAFIERAKQYTRIDALTPELVSLFIQRIEIGEKAQKYARNAPQSIRIVYRDIGMVDSLMNHNETQPRYAKPLEEAVQTLQSAV